MYVNFFVYVKFYVELNGVKYFKEITDFKNLVT